MPRISQRSAETPGRAAHPGRRGSRPAAARDMRAAEHAQLFEACRPRRSPAHVEGADQHGCGGGSVIPTTTTGRDLEDGCTPRSSAMANPEKEPIGRSSDHDAPTWRSGRRPWSMFQMRWTTPPPRLGGIPHSWFKRSFLQAIRETGSSPSRCRPGRRLRAVPTTTRR